MNIVDPSPCTVKRAGFWGMLDYIKCETLDRADVLFTTTEMYVIKNIETNPEIIFGDIVSINKIYNIMTFHIFSGNGDMGDLFSQVCSRCNRDKFYTTVVNDFVKFVSLSLMGIENCWNIYAPKSYENHHCQYPDSIKIYLFFKSKHYLLDHKKQFKDLLKCQYFFLTDVLLQIIFQLFNDTERLEKLNIKLK